MIFVDTGFFYALFTHRDQHHARVVETLETLGSQRLADVLITTNHVVMETITLARKRRTHAQAVFVGERLHSEHFARIHHVSDEEERDAFAYFKRHKDKRYSSVDCVSFVVMEKLGIQEAYAVDRDFTHNFIARPGPIES